MSGFSTPPRRPLDALPNTNINTHNTSTSTTNHPRVTPAVRLVPKTPPQLLGADNDNIYSRPPLPSLPNHFSLPGKSRGPALDTEVSTRGSPTQTTTSRSTQQHPQSGHSATGSPISKPKPQPSRKKLRIHSDKTFSLLQDDSQPVQDEAESLVRSVSQHKSSDSLLSDSGGAGVRSNSITSCKSTVVPATPATQNKQPLSVDPISNSPWNYHFVGGLRKVAKTPDLKQKTVVTTTSDSPLPPLPETTDGPPIVPHDLSTKASFQSTQTATTTSENTNYKVYAGSASSSEPNLPPLSSDEANYQIIGRSSPPSSIIYRPQTATSENENYELHEDQSASFVDLSRPNRYSQESLVVPPLQPRARRSNERLGYYKSRSRESLRTGSLTSISTVLSQQEALRAIVASGSLVQVLPVLKQKSESSSSWANPLRLNPARSHMNEHPHQWSSQLSTVLSVSDGGTDRGSRSWSEGRISSGFPSSTSRHSRQMLSISSSMAQEELGSRSGSVEPPTPAFVRNGQRHYSSSSIGIVADLDEYGDGITDMQDLRARPSRTRLSGLFNTSDSGRTNTMRSTTSSRANSLLGSSIPTWARLYYGSGERRYLGAPGSSTEGSDSRASSFRSGSPNTDHFPLSIYSPRRRPRGMNPRNINRSARGSLEITAAPQARSEQFVQDPHAGRVRTWSMSSIWSPHLRLDRRAIRRSVWEPPVINWSTEGGIFGRRNIQIVMFIAGFVMPFAWMIASILPLPQNPMREMQERDSSTSNLDTSNDVYNDYARQFGPADAARYDSAKWWRGLNRWMSILGVIIIVVVIILVIFGIRNRF